MRPPNSTSSPDDRTLEYRLEATTKAGPPVAAHLTLLPRMKQTLQTGAGQKLTLTESPLNLTPAQLATSLTYPGFELTLPQTASLHWPALPHNPYRKDGHATPPEGRIEIHIPFDNQHPSYTVAITILE